MTTGTSPRAQCPRRRPDSTKTPDNEGMKTINQQPSTIRGEAHRGIGGAQGEWTLHAICHNLRELANAADAANRVPLAAS